MSQIQYRHKKLRSPSVLVRKDLPVADCWSVSTHLRGKSTRSHRAVVVRFMQLEVHNPLSWIGAKFT